MKSIVDPSTVQGWINGKREILAIIRDQLFCRKYTLNSSIIGISHFWETLYQHLFPYFQRSIVVELQIV